MSTINMSMQLASSVFSQNQPIPKKYTCDGENINPPLSIRDVPEYAQNLVLIVDDPDAPGKTWVHWVVFNMPPNTLDIKENQLPPESITGITSFHSTGYGGPCPPSGTHRYVFTLYAVSQKLHLDKSADKEAVLKAIKDITLATAELVGVYHRQK